MNPWLNIYVYDILSIIIFINFMHSKIDSICSIDSFKDSSENS